MGGFLPKLAVPNPHPPRFCLATSLGHRQPMLRLYLATSLGCRQLTLQKSLPRNLTWPLATNVAKPLFIDQPVRFPSERRFEVHAWQWPWSSHKHCGSKRAYPTHSVVMAAVGGDCTNPNKRNREEMEAAGRPPIFHVNDPLVPVSSDTCQTPEHAQSSNLENAPALKKPRVESPFPGDNEKNSGTMLKDPAGSLPSATSPDVEKYSPKDDACHDETLYLIVGLKVQQKLIKRLKELSEKERRYEDDLEMAELVYLLKLLSPSNPMLETFGKKAGKGAMMLLEGDRIMTEGRDLLRSAITDISNYTE